MAVGFGSQLFSRQSPPTLARTLPSPVSCHLRTLGAKRIHVACSLGSKCRGLGGVRRYKQFQVLAFQGDSSLATRSAQEGSMSCQSGTVRYRFIVPQYVTTFGQTLRVVGSLPELGEWNPQRAPTMTWSDGHQWSLECALPQRSFEFKITVFEGHGVKWEGGSNRVVQAEDEDGSIPVEIVVWLTCNFNATSSTQLQLAVPRASMQDAYETGKATLEFLKRRKSKLGQDSSQSSSPEERLRQKTEIARLSEAVAEQSTVVHQLSDWLGDDGAASRAPSRKTGKQTSADATAAEEDDKLLLLAIDSVRVPRVLRRISFVQSWNTGPEMLPENTNGNGVTLGAPPNSPFLRGELDSRAEDLMDAAEVLLKSPPEGSSTSIEWASLAQEAGHVAVAMEALDSDIASSGHSTQLQMRGLASVGSVLAGGSTATELASCPADEVASVGPHVLPAIEVVASSTCAEVTPSIAETATTSVEEQLEPPASSIYLAATPSLAIAVEANSAADAASDKAGLVRIGAAADAGHDTEPAAVSEAHSLSFSRAQLVATEVPSPEAHPLQRLAANVKDLVRMPGSSIASAVHVKAPSWPQRSPVRQDTGSQELRLASCETASSIQPPEQQEREQVHARGRKWTPKFNVRAFLDSLFM